MQLSRAFSPKPTPRCPNFGTGVAGTHEYLGGDKPGGPLSLLLALVRSAVGWFDSQRGRLLDQSLSLRCPDACSRESRNDPGCNSHEPFRQSPLHDAQTSARASLEPTNIWAEISQAARSPSSLLWSVPLLVGLIASAAASLIRVYRFDAPMLAREKAGMILDATLTSLFAKAHSTMPKLRHGRRWNPRIYERR